MNRMLILFYCCLSIGLGAQTETGQNPFELEWRLDKTVLSEDSSIIVQRNPFDVIAHSVPLASENPKAVSNPTKGVQTWLKSLYGDGRDTTNLLFGLAVLLLTFASLTVGLGRGVIPKAWNAFINNNQFILLFREWANRQLFPSFMLLYGNFVVNLSVFVYLSFCFLNDNKIGGVLLWLVCLFGILIVYALKHLVLWLCGNFYPVEQEVSQYNFLISSTNGTIGVFLVPFNLLIAFVKPLQGFLIFWVASLFVIFYILRSVRAFGFSSKLIFGSPFHFLLYLCTVELLPACILLKLAWQNLV